MYDGMHLRKRVMSSLFQIGTISLKVASAEMSVTCCPRPCNPSSHAVAKKNGTGYGTGRCWDALGDWVHWKQGHFGPAAAGTSSMLAQVSTGKLAGCRFSGLGLTQPVASASLFNQYVHFQDSHPL